MLQSLLMLVGNDNTITIHKAVVDFTGSYESAALLEQLLYWTPRAKIPGGWISKSIPEWEEEIYLARHRLEKARKHLVGMGVLELKRKRFNNAVTTHYRVRLDILAEKWARFVEDVQNAKSDLQKSAMNTAENAKSLTETTTEIT